MHLFTGTVQTYLFHFLFTAIFYAHKQKCVWIWRDLKETSNSYSAPVGKMFHYIVFTQTWVEGGQLWTSRPALLRRPEAESLPTMIHNWPCAFSRANRCCSWDQRKNFMSKKRGINSEGFKGSNFMSAILHLIGPNTLVNVQILNKLCENFQFKTYSYAFKVSRS